MEDCVIYARVSTDRQAKEGIGLESQVAACERRLLADWNCVAVYFDAGISGKEGLDGRPGLRAAVDSGLPICAYSISRLARTQKAFVEIVDVHKCKIMSATESIENTTPTGRAMVGILVIFAQLEQEMIGERTRESLAYARSQGTTLGRPVTKVDARTRSLIERLWATGQLSLAGIAKELSRRNVVSANGNSTWDGRKVRNVLRDSRNPDQRDH